MVALHCHTNDYFDNRAPRIKTLGSVCSVEDGRERFVRLLSYTALENDSRSCVMSPVLLLPPLTSLSRSLVNLAVDMHAARSFVLGIRRYADENTADQDNLVWRDFRGVNEKVEVFQREGLAVNHREIPDQIRVSCPVLFEMIRFYDFSAFESKRLTLFERTYTQQGRILL